MWHGAARCGTMLLHAKQANFLHLAHVGDFPRDFQESDKNFLSYSKSDWNS